MIPPRTGNGVSRKIALTPAQVLFVIFSSASLIAVAAGRIFSGSAGGFFPSVPAGAPAPLSAAAGAAVLSVVWDSRLVPMLGALLLVSLAGAVFPTRIGPVFVYVIVFFLSLLYASSRDAPFPYRYGERVELKAKILSDYRVRGKTLQYVARVKGIYVPGGIQLGGRGDRVLLKVPPKSPPPARGDIIRVSGLFTELPYEKARSYALYLKSNGIAAIFEGYGRGMRVTRKGSPYAPFGLASLLKRHVRRVNDRLLPWPQSEFAVSLFTGNRDDLPRELADAFVRSGTMHLLAVSGLHFGFLTLFFFYILKLFRLNVRVIYVLLIALTLFYMIFIGDAPSVRRSAIMVLCGIAVFLLDRDRHYFNILAIAFCILWCLNPLAPFNPGFLLSFSATFALFFLVPPINRFLGRFLPNFLAVSLSVSFGVQVYLWPVLLAYFGSFPYVNVAANIPLVPLTGLSLGLELSYLVVYPVFLPLASVIAEVNTVVVTLILRLAGLFAEVPPVTVDGFPGYLIPVYFTAVTFGVWILTRKISSLKTDVFGER